MTTRLDDHAARMQRLRIARLAGLVGDAYAAGYERGLRRLAHGDRFGTEAEQALWLKLADDADEMRAERGRGYRDAIGGRELPAGAEGTR